MRTREIWESVHSYAAMIDDSMEEIMCGWGETDRQATIREAQRLATERGPGEPTPQDLEDVAADLVELEAAYHE